MREPACPGVSGGGEGTTSSYLDQLIYHMSSSGYRSHPCDNIEIMAAHISSTVSPVQTWIDITNQSSVSCSR